MAEHDGGTPRWLYWLTVGAVAALEVSAMAALFFFVIALANWLF